MPKTPMDYSKTIIYKIEHINDDNLVYVGHTTNWDKRKCCHKSRCNNEKGKSYNYKLYQMMRDNGGWDMFKMIEVEKFPCNYKREAERRENEVMKDLKANMNKVSSYVTEEEKKERDIKNAKEYYKESKTKIEKYKKEYSIKHKDEIKEYKKAWYETNKDKVIKNMNERYNNNKEQINEKKTCECGCNVTKFF
jgi:hypothetical protein